MIKNFKMFESTKAEFLLCVKKSHKDWFYKFTLGKKYEIYNSLIGVKIRDDNGRAINTNMFISERINEIIIYKYADCILTTADSIEEYEIFKNANKYNL